MIFRRRKWNNPFNSWCDGVILVAMKKAVSERYEVLLLVGEFDFCGVKTGVEFTADS
jgi:hypothetical protein